MAKRKDIKQDINQLVGEVVADCVQYLKSHPGKGEGKANEILSEILKLRKDLLFKVNHVDEAKESKKIKAHYYAIIVDLIEKTDDAFKKISALPRK